MSHRRHWPAPRIAFLCDLSHDPQNHTGGRLEPGPSTKRPAASPFPAGSIGQSAPAAKRFKFPYPAQHTNWQDEQEAIHKTAVLFDQSHHMTDVYFRGPDVKRLLSDTGTNSFATYGRDRAKHFVTCNEDGYMIGTAVLFGLEEDEANLVGPSAAAN